MLRYVVRRLLLTIPTLFLVATIVFLLLRLVPGDMVDTVMARLAVLGGTVDRAALERAFGLDAPAACTVRALVGRPAAARQPGHLHELRTAGGAAHPGPAAGDH